MPETTFCNRRAVALENGLIRVSVLAECGHVAEILDTASGVNPLWIPPWPAIEPSQYSAAKHDVEYGPESGGKMLASVMGHNLCMDIFGGPSDEEAAAGLTLHGEASVVPYRITLGADTLTAVAELPKAQLRFQRELRLSPDSRVIRFTENVQNLSEIDRPIGWQEHVTLGPPFLEKGCTRFRIPATRSKTFEGEFGETNEPDAEFHWPYAPLKGGGTRDLSHYSDAETSGGFTTHLMDLQSKKAWFMAWSPRLRVLFGYIWNPSDFPWLGMWEENHSRYDPPWNGKTLTLGMEFGVSPMPQSRKRMIERTPLFGAPGYRWIPAQSSVRAEYCAFIVPSDRLPEDVTWEGGCNVLFH